MEVQLSHLTAHTWVEEINPTVTKIPVDTALETLATNKQLTFKNSTGSPVPNTGLEELPRPSKAMLSKLLMLLLQS